MPVRHYCTLFDKNYMSRGLALGESLRTHSPGARWYVLCLDDEAFYYLSDLGLPGVTLVKRSTLEEYDPELAATQSTRSKIEYYFTITPAWIRFVMNHFPEANLVTYIDADFLMFASPEPLFAELGDKSIAVVEHRYPPHLKKLEPWGHFNVGWLSFRRDQQGQACIEWWRERCIEWCYDRIEGDRFADQKYLEQWPKRYSRLVVLQHPGVSVAPWNIEPSRFALRNGQPIIDGEPVICFHYHGLKHVLGPVYESGLRAFGVHLDERMRNTLFEPYLERLLHYEKQLAAAGITRGHARSARLSKNTLTDAFWTATMLVGSLVKGTYLWARA